MGFAVLTSAGCLVAVGSVAASECCEYTIFIIIMRTACRLIYVMTVRQEPSTQLIIYILLTYLQHLTFSRQVALAGQSNSLISGAEQFIFATYQPLTESRLGKTRPNVTTISSRFSAQLELIKMLRGPEPLSLSGCLVACCVNVCVID